MFMPKGGPHRAVKVNKNPRSAAVKAAVRKFLDFFPEGFRDETYRAWERDYKLSAHRRWEKELGKSELAALIKAGKFQLIADTAVRVESRTNLLFSFEKMALRDAVRSKAGAKIFSQGLYDFLYQSGSPERKFNAWVEAVEKLPRKQTRVLTWPVLTVFPFLALPDQHIFLKPKVTRIAASRLKLDFDYRSRPNWETYRNLLALAETVRADVKQLKPHDMIDIQSFIWVQGSTEYE